MSKAEDQDSASLAENKAKEEKPPKKSIKS